MEELADVVDTLITIPNDRLLAIVPRGTSIKQSFRVADDILRQAVQGISDIICTPGVINLDFSDIKATMLGMGHAIMGTATARGEKAAVDAARQAISCPLLEDTKIKGSKRILINITSANTLGIARCRRSVHHRPRGCRQRRSADNLRYYDRRFSR